MKAVFMFEVQWISYSGTQLHHPPPNFFFCVKCYLSKGTNYMSLIQRHSKSFPLNGACWTEVFFPSWTGVWGLSALPEEAVCVPFPVLDRSAVHRLTLTREEVCWKQIGRAAPSFWDLVFAACAVRNAKEAICRGAGIAAAETPSGKWRRELQMWPRLQQPDFCTGLWCNSGCASDICLITRKKTKKNLRNDSRWFKKNEKSRE